MRSKTQMLKTASNLKEFSTKVKSAQIGETLTPEAVQEISQEIMEVATVAAELASEIAEGVPAEEGGRDALGDRGREEKGPEQIEVAAEETDDEKNKRMQKEAQDKDDDDKDKNKIKELEASLEKIERKATLAELAPKYASLFPKEMHEAKMNEILQSKEPLNIVQNTIKVASDIITNKTMVKIASMSDSIYDIGNTSDGSEINISGVI